VDCVLLNDQKKSEYKATGRSIKLLKMEADLVLQCVGLW